MLRTITQWLGIQIKAMKSRMTLDVEMKKYQPCFSETRALIHSHILYNSLLKGLVKQRLQKPGNPPTHIKLIELETFDSSHLKPDL